jgi:hypothetical protein
VAWHFASVFNACLIEVCETASYARLTRFLVWCKMARGEKKTTIEPSSPDVAEYDLVVFGSPVKAFKPTPPIDSLEECMGKPDISFSTHGGRPGQTDENVQKMDRSPWDVTAAVTNIPRNAVKNEMQTKELVACLCFNEGRIF